MQPKASLEDRIVRTLERVDQDLPTIPVVLSRNSVPGPITE